ncbi:MAG: hypothetical protein ACOH2H_11020 [Cypionkella sp.]
MTFKGLIIATGGDVPAGAIRKVLNDGLAAFDLSRAEDGCYLLKVAA